MEFVVAFAPDDSQDFTEAAYLEVTGRQARIPVALHGTGIGPRLTFAYDVVDVGDVFVSSVHRYELLLINRGEIDASWQIGTNAASSGSAFVFEPAAGVLAVGESAPISVYMSANAMGEFSEVFELVMRGCTAVLHVHFKGTVVAPSFHLDTDTFAFGEVPFGFTQTQRFGLYNTSDVPFTYRLRVPRDTGPPAAPRREFSIEPSQGTLAPGGMHHLQLDFTPSEVKDYEGFELMVDIDRVGAALLALPITARSVVPRVTLETPVVTFGECFARHPYEAELVFVNTEPAPARYSILPQDEQSAVVASFTTEHASGVVPPRGRHSVPVTLTCFQLGPIALPMYVAMAGNGGQPLAAELRAVGRGPLIAVAPASLSWGTVQCLTAHVLKLTVQNKGLIPAPVALRSKSKSARAQAIGAPSFRHPLWLPPPPALQILARASPRRRPHS